MSRRGAFSGSAKGADGRLLGRWTVGIGGAAVAWAAQAQPVPYTSLGQTPSSYQPSASPLGDALRAARSGDINRADQIAASMGDPAARKLVLWAQIDAAGSMLSLSTLQGARASLAGWPRPARREAAFEKAMETGGASPSTVIEAFASGQPDTAEGALALATSLEAQGRAGDAQTLIRTVWRERTFDADVQTRMYARYGRWITADDVVFRLDALLYGQQGPAARALMSMVDAEHQAAAQARIAFRNDSSGAPSQFEALSPTMQRDPGVVFERARYLLKRGSEVQAVQAVQGIAPPPTPDAAAATWAPRRQLLNAALKNQDGRGAYGVVLSHGLTSGSDYTEAEAFLGWLALNKLHDAHLADSHFQNVQRMGATPVTLSRAYYWRGRTAEALGDSGAAQGFYGQGAQYTTAFYGQLAAEKMGETQLRLPADPTPTAQDRATFDSRETVQALRLLIAGGDKELVRTFALSIDDSLSSAGEFTLLVDMIRSTGDQDLAMRVARASGMKGFPLPERGWPVRSIPTGEGRPEAAFSLAIARQESNFDPNARSAFARGLMQLRPQTGASVAHRLGMPFSADRLDDPDYNLSLGSAYLGNMVDNFGGSYVMAAAGYNAGPGRPISWVQTCADPRKPDADPADFIECIPFSETRNYVMRVMENTAIYRARLNGGSARLTPMADLHRGAWPPVGGASNTSGPIPYTQLVGGGSSSTAGAAESGATP